MDDIVGTIIAVVANYYDTALAIVGAFAAIATLTPNKSDDAVVQQLLNLVNFAGANFGKAANPKDDA